jgi:hypothetical protein
MLMQQDLPKIRAEMCTGKMALAEAQTLYGLKLGHAGRSGGRYADSRPGLGCSHFMRVGVLPLARSSSPAATGITPLRTRTRILLVRTQVRFVEVVFASDGRLASLGRGFNGGGSVPIFFAS